jgi:hypothetical protein
VHDIRGRIFRSYRRIRSRLTGHFLDCFDRGDALSYLENTAGKRIPPEKITLSDHTIVVAIETLFPGGWEAFGQRIRHHPIFVESTFEEV